LRQGIVEGVRGGASRILASRGGQIDSDGAANIVAADGQVGY